MKVSNRLLVGALCAAAVLSLVAFVGCKNSSSDSPTAADTNAIIDGSSEDDGDVTATFVDGELKVDSSDSMNYVFSGLAGVGKFEVKSSASSWTNVTADTMSVISAGSDKIAKLNLELTGTSAQQCEVAYNIGAPKDITGKSVSFKIYIPAVYAESGASAYPMIALWTKTSSWTATKFAEFNTLNIGSGWKTITVDFAAKTFSVDGTALTAGTGETLAFSDANLANLADTKLVVIGFYGESLPSTMTGEFYLDWFNISGMSTPVLSAPVITKDVNSVSITAASGATIYYTTDGTDPTTSSNVYSSAFAITADTTVKAFATKDGYTKSVIATKACTWVDTSVVDPYADTAAYAFASGVQGFAMESYGEGSLSWAADETSTQDGVLVVSRGAASAKTAIGLYTNSAPISITGKTISFRVYIPASYITEATMGIKFFFKNSSWTGFYSWTGVNNGTIVAGWNTVSLTVDSSNFSGVTSADSDTVNEIGIEFDPNNASSAVTDDLKVDWIDIQ